jgi:uncharacterized membrane protein
MKNRYVFIIVLLLMAVGFSCTDESTYPVNFDELNNSNAGILKQVSVISVAFNKFDIPNATYEVVLEANDRDRGKLFTSVDLFVSFVDRTPASGNGNNSKAEVKLKTYQNAEFVNDATTGLPRITALATAPEAVAALGLTTAELEGSDQFIFRQAMNFPDGRVFSSDNVTTAIASGGGVYKSPFQNIVAVVCPSDLGGTINYTTVVTAAVVPIAPCLPSISGTTTWTVLGPGAYSVADATFGQYDCAWNDNPAAGVTLNDACNLLSLTGSDQYGLIYTFVITANDGTTMRINWSNDYGDAGYSDLTRTGKTWPLTLTF